MEKTILGAFSEKGILLDPRAVDALTKLPNATECFDRIINDGDNRPLVLTEEDVLRYALDGDGGACTAREAVVQPEGARKQITPVERRVIVLKDITGNSTCVGNVIDFAKLFNDRYSTIKKMLSKRRDLAGLIPITKVKKLKRDLRFAGIVNDSRTTKNGHTMIELEDETDKIQVLVMKDSRRDGETYLKDEILGVIGALSKDGEIVMAKDIVRPGIPLRRVMTPNGSDSIVAFVSDIHIGSNTFLEKAWKRFMAWLKTSAVAEDVKYIVMPGDLVDGIGIYPGQEDELEIDDLFDQYSLLAETVKEFPDWVQLVMMPGNHDAVRLAEPQPALSGDIKDLFDSSVQFVGNPCYMEIEGRTILAYHGKSMDDFNS
ncbi:MAG: metallophosphoesterase, partial [Thermoplasmata archaeon]|nr:metallophosphoesterase [Thermoplasmata archaeon]